MKFRLLSAMVICLALGAAVYAQDQNPGPADNQNPAGQNEPGGGGAQGGGGRGRGGFGRGGMGMGGMGRGVAGTVTEVAADHYTVKSFSGETYTIHYSANTRMMKQPAGMGRRRGGEGGGNGGWRRGEGGGGNPPEPIKPTDIKVGDSIAAMGEVDAAAKSVGAVGIVLLDPERAKQMAQMEADYGKTWLMGRVTAVEGTTVTVKGGPANASHSFTADENTTFRQRREPITLGDVKVGDMVRVEGAVKNGVFTATSVADMGAPGEGR